MRTAALLAGSLACLLAAAALALLALDAGRWGDALAAGDVRYRANPAASDLWRPSDRFPFGAARRLLDVEDDLAFRDAVRALRLGRFDEGFTSDPALALPRAEAQARLQVIGASDPERARRSRALGLLGVVGLANSVAEIQDREALLRAGLANLRRAIALDPDNDEAKANLQRAVRRGEAIEVLPGSGAPEREPGGLGARGAGAGKPGSGY